MKKFAHLILFTSLLIAQSKSQTILGTCGTTREDNEIIKQRMIQNREEWKNKTLERSGALTYVPITYWAVAQDAGTNRIPYTNIISNLCCLNKTYSEFGISFYLKAIVDWNKTSVYDDPSSNLGKAFIDQKMQVSLNAVNIFVTNGVNVAQPGVLAFYTPNGDYVVCGKKNLTASCPTLAHEIGHFFSLAHTFNGWEDIVYTDLTMNCVKATPPVLSNGALVEYVDRNKPGTVPTKKNCQEAADGFCDTPADYNLGFGWTGCNYNGCAKDPDGVQLDPSEVNLMSYFLDCIKEFTPEQKAAITKDEASAKRNFLRKVTYTPKPDVVDQPNYLTPTAGAPAQGYDTIRFDWDDVPNAEAYIFDLSQSISFSPIVQTFIIKKSDTILTNFKPGVTYFWKVTPYNANSFCIVPKIANFKSPVWTVSSDNIEDNTFSSYVTESSESSIELNIQSNKAQSVTIQILNLNGQIYNTITKQIVEGFNRIPLNQIPSGFYLYRIISDNQKQNTGKFVKL